MAAVLLIGGISFLLAGLVAIGFGIPVKEFSFGNTLILTGAIVACTGAIMLGLWSAVRELKRIARQLGSTVPSESRAESVLSSDNVGEVPGRRPPENAGSLFSRDQPTSSAGNRDSAMQSPNRFDDAARRDREDVQAREPVDAARSAKPRRNLLFSSTSRRERERAQARTAEPYATDLDTGSSAPAPSNALGQSSEIPAASFEDSWPKLDRPRGGDRAAQRPGGRSPSTLAEPGAGLAEAESHPPSGQSDSQPPVTVLKSGVVDGMAYSLYSDGSIEAQMPEGMMRFASINELRAHLDQRP
jgi:hypothetical protein